MSQFTNPILSPFLTNLFSPYENYLKFANFVNGQFGGSVNWNYEIFDTLYRTSWVADKVVTVVADDMTDKWRTFHHDDPRVVEIRQKYEEENEIKEIMREVIFQSRLYGGAALIPIIEGQFDDKIFKTKFDVSSVQKDSLKGFQTLTRFDFQPLAGINRDIYQDPKLFGDYIYYQIIRIQTMLGMGEIGTTANEPLSLNNLPTIHASRMIKFYGKELPYYQKFFSGGWGDSILVPLIDKIPAIEEAFHLMFLYLDLYNIDEIQIHNLSAIVQSDAGIELFKKYKAFREKMRATKCRFVDSSDSMNRNQLSSIANITPVFQSLLQFVTGATGIPITRILGTSVGGWSTGDNELTQYYDLIAQYQNKARPQLKLIDSIIEMNLFGKIMDISYKFPPKREITEKEKEEIKKSKADTFAIYLQNRVMTPKVVAENIKEDFEGLDEAYIESLEDDFLSYETEMADIQGDQEPNEEKKESDNSKTQEANTQNNE